MAVDYAKVYFLSTKSIDKILYTSPITSDTYTGADPTNPVTHSFTIAHSIPTPVVVNGMFSIDGTNFYPCGLDIEGSPSGIVNASQYLQCDMYADASNVHVYIENGFDTTQTVSIYYVLESLT
jgi:hypothetical protein